VGAAVTLPDNPESSFDLLVQAKAGNDDALNRLLGRYIPRLERWVSGRMPHGIRSMNDTADIVQESVINALRNLDTLEIRSEGALLAYLRQAVNNRIIDQYRRHGRRPPRVEIPIDAAAVETSPLEAAIGVEAMENYERALGGLREKDQRVIILHVEFGMKAADLAAELGLDTPAAARMAVQRALKKLADAMRPAIPPES
jgi:RNA polymerase sigma-70 factor (ECF subfamily)